MRPLKRLAKSLTIGVDLGDKRSRLYTNSQTGDQGEDGLMPTMRVGLTRFCAGRPPCRVVLEGGTHSP